METKPNSASAQPRAAQPSTAQPSTAQPSTAHSSPAELRTTPLRTAQLRTAEASSFLSLYRSMRIEAGGIPPKANLTAERVVGMIGHVFIVEARPDGYFFRLFGTEIARITGTDHTGHYLHEVLSGNDLAQVAGLMDRCLKTPVIVATTERLLYKGREFVEVKILRCPFADETGEPRYLCGTFAAIGVTDRSAGPKVLQHQDLPIEWHAETQSEIPIS